MFFFLQLVPIGVVQPIYDVVNRFNASI